MNRALLGLGLAAAVVAVALSLYVAGHPFIAQDAVLERDVQSVDWGPLTYVFQFIGWIGDAKGLAVEVIVFLAVLLWNRRAWLFAGAAALTGAWYELASHLVNRPRPTTAGAACDRAPRARRATPAATRSSWSRSPPS